MGIDLGSIMDTESTAGSIRSGTNKTLQRGLSHTSATNYTAIEGGEGEDLEDDDDLEEIDNMENEDAELLMKMRKKKNEKGKVFRRQLSQNSNHLTTNLDVIGAMSAVSLCVCIFILIFFENASVYR